VVVVVGQVLLVVVQVLGVAIEANPTEIELIAALLRRFAAVVAWKLDDRCCAVVTRAG
jgi:hypothetical protein